MGIHGTFILPSTGAPIRALDHHQPLLLGRPSGHICLDRISSHGDSYHSTQSYHLPSHADWSSQNKISTKCPHNYSPIHSPFQHRSHVALCWSMEHQTSLPPLFQAARCAHNPMPEPLVVDRLLYMSHNFSYLFCYPTVQVLFYHFRGSYQS